MLVTENVGVPVGRGLNISSTRGTSVCLVQARTARSRCTWECGWTSWSWRRNTLSYRHKIDQLLTYFFTAQRSYQLQEAGVST